MFQLEWDGTGRKSVFFFFFFFFFFFCFFFLLSKYVIVFIQIVILLKMSQFLKVWCIRIIATKNYGQEKEKV